MGWEDNTIDMFMWGYQHFFRSSVQSKAKALFHRLDANLNVETFLLGIIREPEQGFHTVCIEPEDCGWDPSQFGSIREDAEHFLAIDGDENLMATAESHMNAIQARRRRKAIKRAVMKALDASTESTRAKRHYFSGFTKVGKYDVGIVLAISQFERGAHYQLPKIHAEERFACPRSLVDCVAEVFLGECLGSLYVPNPEFVDSLNDHHSDDLLRRAGDRLMVAPVFAAHGIEGLYGLFETCNFIASLNYEGVGSKGGLIIAREDHPNVRPSIRLAKPFLLNQHRAVRKLLEISATGDSLITDGAYLRGFGIQEGRYDQTEADLFQVRFIGHHKWELLHADHVLMRVNYGVPSVPIPALREPDFISTLQILFPGITKDACKKQYDLACEACRQRHGTIIIITPAAQSEVVRLMGQATVIQPISMTSKILESVTAIDGAVILDLEGVCHAIGAILDGVAIPDGTPARGARFNSCLRYVHALKAKDTPCLAVVVSEDGSAELIPALPRRIRRSELEAKERRIDEILGAEKWSLDQSFPILNWLDEHRFYLSDNLCEKANQLMQKHDEVLRKRGGIMLVRQKYEPCSSMSDDFLI